MIVGEALNLIAEGIGAICDTIPDPICIVVCGTNPLTIACYAVRTVVVILASVYGFFKVSESFLNRIIGI